MSSSSAIGADRESSETEVDGNGVTGGSADETGAGGGDGGGVATISASAFTFTGTCSTGVESAVASLAESDAVNVLLLITGLVGVAGGVVGGLEAPSRVMVALPTTESVVEAEIVAVAAMMDCLIRFRSANRRGPSRVLFETRKGVEGERFEGCRRTCSNRGRNRYQVGKGTIGARVPDTNVNWGEGG